MSNNNIKTPGFRSSEILEIMKTNLIEQPQYTRDKLIKNVKGTIEFYVMTNEGKTETFTINLKNYASIIKGKGLNRPDAIISIRDVDFLELAKGKLSGQKAYSDGKIKVKGAAMLVPKLNVIFRSLARNKAKL